MTTTLTANSTRVRLARRVLAICAISALSAAGLSACSSGSSGASNGTGASADSSQSGNGVPKRGGELTAYSGTAPSSFDPAFVTSQQFGTYQPIYGLLFYTDATTDKVVPYLGKSLQPNSGTDCKVWTMDLRPQVKFSDGTPLNAAAVEYNYKRILDPKLESQLTFYVKNVSYKVLAPYKLQISLPASNCSYDQIVANYLDFIGSPTAMKNEGSNYFAKPVGAGPFVLKTWNRSSGRVTYVRNPTYWKKGLPYLDTLEMIPASNQNAALDSLLSGQVQFSPPLVSVPAYDQAVQHGLGTWKMLMNGGYAMQFNVARRPFNKPCARLAFAYGLDPAGIVQATNPSKLLNGAANTVFEPGSPYYDANIKFPSNNRAKSIAEAKQCADEGDPVNFAILEIAGNNTTAGSYMASRLNTIPGIHVTQRVVQSTQLRDIVGGTHDFQVAFWPNSMTFGDPIPSLDSFIRTGGSLNLIGYSNPKLDAALDQGGNSQTLAGRKKAYDTLQKIWVHDIPFWIYGKAYNYFIFGKDVTGVKAVNPGDTTILMDQFGYKK